MNIQITTRLLITICGLTLTFGHHDKAAAAVLPSNQVVTLQAWPGGASSPDLPQNCADAAICCPVDGVALVNVKTGRFRFLTKDNKAPLKVVESPDGRYVVSVGHWKVYVQSCKTGKEVPAAYLDSSPIYGASFAGSDDLVAISYINPPVNDKFLETIRLWSLSAHETLWSTQWSHYSWVLKASNKGSMLAVGLTHGVFAIIDVKTGRETLLTLPKPDGAVNAACFSPDDKFVAVGTRTGYCIVLPVDLSGYVSRWRMARYVSSIAYCAGGRAVAVGNIGTHAISFFEAASGRKVSAQKITMDGNNDAFGIKNVAWGLAYSSKFDTLVVTTVSPKVWIIRGIDRFLTSELPATVGRPAEPVVHKFEEDADLADPNIGGVSQ